jgi:acyl-CoA synthetase (AMP-forming)/AMP-acid ligase II
MNASQDFPPNLPHKPTTLIELLQLRAQAQPDLLLYKFLVDGESEEQNVTIAEFERLTRRVAAWLLEHNLSGERALLLFPPGIDFIAAYMGCLYAGVIAVPSYPPRINRPSPRIQTIVADSDSAIVLTTGEIYASMEQRFEHTPDLKDLIWLDTATIPQDLENQWKPPAITPETLAFLQYTSGSTSQPKGVMVSHANLLHNLEMIRQGFHIDSEETAVIWLPNYHDMGLIGGILEPLYYGGTSILMSPFHFLQRPLRWLQAISNYKSTISGGPNFAFDIGVEKTTPEQRQELDLSSWRCAFSGAEPVRYETMKRFIETFAISGLKPDIFSPCYGLAEGTLFVTAVRRPSEPKYQPFSKQALAQDKIVPVPVGSPDAQAFVGCGVTRLEEKIVIANPETLRRCAPDEVGEIWISSTSVAKGYWKRPDETARIFQAHLEDSGDGPFLRTGDLGFLWNDELFITGRSKDLIIIRGSNHYPQDIELTVEQCHPALEPAGGAAFSIDIEDEERLVIVQELSRQHRKADQDEIFRAIRRAVSEYHDLQVFAIQLLKPLSVPKTSSGKIQRHACKIGYLEGTLETLGEWKAPQRTI